ncbi:MAG: SDR family NAD(P)-dependent oxidoreductase [Bacteroidales bacterium]
MANILITGGSRGIGKSIVEYLAAEQQHRILVISRTVLPLQADNVFFLSFDLGQIHLQAEHLFEQVNAYFNSIDIIINNAGLLTNKSFEDTTFNEAERMVYLNYLAPAWLVRTLLPLLKRANHPHVVNIGSMGGVQGSSKYKGLAWYSSSKAAMSSLTECLAVELAQYNIAVNCLALGAVNTEMLQEAFPGYRAPVEPAQIARFIAEFAQSAHQVMNGKIVPVALSNP